MKTNEKGIIIPDFMIVLRWIDKGGKCAYDLLNELNITYKHLHEIKHTFLKKEWIRLVKDNRRQIMILTDLGREKTEAVNKFLMIMDMDDDTIKKLLEKSKHQKRKTVINEDDFFSQIDKEVEHKFED